MASNITYNGIDLGDYGFINIDYGRSSVTNPIPRAEGVIIFNMGGGTQTITANCWVIKDTPELASIFLEQLPVLLGGGPADLVVDGVTYSNTFLEGFSPDSQDSRGRNFSITFVRSAV